MASKPQTVDFGKFLSGLATKADPATSETLAGLQEKMKAEKQAQLEGQLRHVFSQIQFEVSQLRDIRRKEKVIQGRISDLEAKANKLVAGEDPDES